MDRAGCARERAPHFRAAFPARRPYTRFMIARLWRAQIDVTRREEFEQIGESELLPLLERFPGFGGVLFLAREPEAALLTLWSDEQSADYFAQ